MNEETFTATQKEALNSLFSKFESGEVDPQAIKSEFTGILENQMKWSKGVYDKKQEQIKTYEQILSEAGWDPSQHENKKQFVESVKNQKQELELTKSEKETLRERIARLEAVERERTEEATKLKAENERNTITSKLTESLLANKINDKATKLIVKDCINEGRVKVVDGEVMFVVNGEYVTFDKGIGSIVEENKEFVVSSQIAGVGSFKNNVKSSSSPLTVDVINKMTPEQIKANLPEIKRMVGLK